MLLFREDLRYILNNREIEDVTRCGPESRDEATKRPRVNWTNDNRLARIARNEKPRQLDVNVTG
jgi:hypothetical protein